jgi:hypothetical protein
VNLSFEIKPRDFGRHTTLNAKVIETWINETLLDAEHLDIPGVVLKPEHKNPVSRYSIDRLTLTVTYIYKYKYNIECWCSKLRCR